MPSTSASAILTIRGSTAATPSIARDLGTQRIGRPRHVGEDIGKAVGLVIVGPRLDSES